MDGAPQISSPTRSFDSNITLRSPIQTPLLLQNHLYEAFLSGETADISLRVSGTWNAVYRLHRIVLTQAGFFRSLFTSGFMEGSMNASVAQGEVRVRFDHDPNITRSAFEICLARLYGGGPALYVCPSLQPTPAEPLTSAYMRPWIEKQPVPKDHQPASPRFLLSLLSTAFYLSIPTLASEALNLILASIGPTTVIRYFDYALGKGIGEPGAAEPDRAATLEHIGKEIDSASICTTRTESTHDSYKTDEEDHDDPLEKSGEISTSDGPNSNSSPTYLYGVVSNKIGESCAAFLARWGVDLLINEEEIGPHLAASKHIYSDRVPLGQSSSPTTNWKSARSVPRIWSQGLSAEWVYGVLSSDELFVKSEQTRYDVAKRVVEMRRRLHGIVPEEEAQWTRLFEQGIYYSHFSWEDMVAVSEDRSPTTDSSYVSISTIQAAHWNSDMLKRLISKQDSLRGPGTTDSNDRKGLELGLKIDSPSIKSTDKTKRNSSTTSYWPIPTDTSLRIGDPGSAAPTESLFNSSPSRDQTGRRSVAAQNFFGIGNPRRDREAILLDETRRSQTTSKPEAASQWVAYEPFRFSVEFWGVDSLKERTRLHSQTVFYAGSCYNVYTQAVWKKGLQLGVYLHRQSNVDPIPAASAPRASSVHSPPSSWPMSLPNPSNMTSASTSPTAVTGARPHARSVPSSEASSRGHTPAPVSRSQPHRSTTPVGVPRSPRIFHGHSFGSSSPAITQPRSPIPHPSIGLLSNASQHFSSPPMPPSQPYRDPRPAISAYFSIACHSMTGSSLTRFSSAPDTFAVSQSWGWKSSSLDVGESGNEQDIHESSLRATVVIGLV